VPGKTKSKIYAKPYVVTPLEWLKREASSLEKSEASLIWVNNHYWQQLTDRVSTLKAEDEEEKRVLPRSQMSDLRSGLFLGKEEADARLKLIWNRYKNLGLDKVVIDFSENPSLFWSELEKDKETKKGKMVWITNFLDAVDAADFLDTSVDLITSD
jgi:sugar/nucleoside kinase (ribokinase family)